MATEAGAHKAAEAAGGLAVDPMHQFVIQPIVPIRIGSLDLSFTNSALWMFITVGVVAVFLLLGGSRLVPSRWQAMKEATYEFVADLVRDVLGDEGRRFFPFIFALFMFIFTANMLGLVPYSFTVTSHIIVTFAFAFFIFVLATVLGFMKNGLRYLKLFVPSGVPPFLIPVIVPIEVISYFMRPISHSVRLFANMMAGHAMMKVFASFVIGLGIIGGWVPLAFLVAVTALEVLVAFLQAFVFVMLAAIYINDAFHPEH
jgi:F-type H+-transporting ATPase subunit a